ncbi:MAG: FtsW/RodA/SpoVE family cell cycle protein [Acidimicrobiales bacterium]|nr:FtsW/RodA/SpoVE family cell cycle protein [Acidimicrobiales bacterium]
MTGLIMLQPNLGTAIIIAAMVLVMLLAAGVPLVPLGVATAVGTLVATAFVALTPFRRTRFLRFLDPMGDPLGSGLQNVQSLVAMANGGVFGRGLGRSTVKWGYLPYAWTDFIFAVIGEEFSLLGAVTVVALFLALAAVGAWVAAQAQDRFSMLVHRHRVVARRAGVHEHRCRAEHHAPSRACRSRSSPSAARRCW